MIAPVTGLTDALRVLVDPTRLRILGLLELDELSVGELARALEMAQSRVSNHLRVLRDAKLLDERHVGRTTYLRLAVPASSATSSAVTSTHSAKGSDTDVATRLWQALRPEIPTIPEFASDVARLQRVLQERNLGAGDFFDRVAGEWDKIGVEFATGQARHRAAASLLPRELVLADLGCGTGYMARALVGLCRRLVCVDRSQAMLDEAQKKLGHVPAGVAVEFRRGEMDHLPIEDMELDGCVAAMVLHHLPDLRLSLAEMFRTLKPGGRAVVLELAPHKEAWMHESLGDRHLGLDSRDVLRAFERAGFVEVALESVEDRYEPRRTSSEIAAARAEHEPIAPVEESRRSSTKAADSRGKTASSESLESTSTQTASLALYIVRGRRPARNEAP